uniref:V-set immunoregulatory receptor n=1 Tax=Oryzias sinensis TaxID=183150 RepID=A0A8C7XAB1_9TELE
MMEQGRTARNFWMLWILWASAAAKVETHQTHSTLGVSAPHLHYYCPQGSNAKLVCAQKGDTKYPKDVLARSWLFTPHSGDHCQKNTGPRNTNPHHPGKNQTVGAGLDFGHAGDHMWVTLHNVTSADQGRYCCLLLDIKNENKHLTVEQSSHSHLILHVTPWKAGSPNCTVWDFSPPEGSVPVALALAACILALLSLPLVLVLVYKQRQNSQSGRRGQELVRMDSEGQGHENPVFLGELPHAKSRTVSQIMTRQTSETGCHLLSDPGTPLSPPAHGDVFFPSEDVIPESPDLLQ